MLTWAEKPTACPKTWCAVGMLGPRMLEPGGQSAEDGMSAEERAKMVRRKVFPKEADLIGALHLALSGCSLTGAELSEAMGIDHGWALAL